LALQYGRLVIATTALAAGVGIDAF
jgi:hypothetical protein